MALCGAADAADEGITHVAHRVVDDGILVTYELASPRPCDVELWVLRANRPYQYKARSVTGDVGPAMRSTFSNALSKSSLINVRTFWPLR